MSTTSTANPKLLRADAKILNILLSSSGKLEPYTIFRRSKLGSSFFFERYLSLTKRSYIVETDGVAELSPEGNIRLKQYLSESGSTKKNWREVPSKYLRKKLDAGEFYIPNLDLLSRKTFKF